jgi:hypothetical protein
MIENLNSYLSLLYLFINTFLHYWGSIFNHSLLTNTTKPWISPASSHMNACVWRGKHTQTLTHRLVTLRDQAQYHRLNILTTQADLPSFYQMQGVLYAPPVGISIASYSISKNQYSRVHEYKSLSPDYWVPLIYSHSDTHPSCSYSALS